MHVTYIFLLFFMIGKVHAAGFDSDDELPPLFDNDLIVSPIVQPETPPFSYTALLNTPISDHEVLPALVPYTATIMSTTETIPAEKSSLSKRQCSRCDKTFANKSHLNRHIKSKHEGIREQCIFCDKQFTEKESLKVHIKSVHEKVTYQCSFCEKSFTDRSNLNAHKRRKHPESSERTKRQRLASARHSASTEDVLYEDISHVYKEARSQCSLCAKIFSRTSDLNKHVKNVHKRESRQHCPACDKNFCDKYALNTHIKSMHEGERQQCSFCDKTFAYKSHLNRHTRSEHQGINEQCIFCAKRFTEKESLKAHIKSVHEKVTYQCSFCEKSFTDRSNLNAHKRRKHSEIAASTKRQRTRSSDIHESQNSTGLSLSAEEVAAFFNCDPEGII